MNDILVKLDEDFDENEYQLIELFRERFRILWGNWESLKALGINLGGTFSNKSENKKITGDSCNIEIYRLKGFFVDFRFLYAEKEPTKYFNIASLLGKKCKDKRLHSLLKKNKDDWHNAGLFEGWHNFTAEEMLNYYFHGEIFHSFADKREGLRKILDVMESDVAAHEITFAIYNRMLVVRNLNWVLSPLSIQNQHIRLPSDYV